MPNSQNLVLRKFIITITLLFSTLIVSGCNSTKTSATASQSSKVENSNNAVLATKKAVQKNQTAQTSALSKTVTKNKPFAVRYYYPKGAFSLLKNNTKEHISYRPAKQSFTTNSKTAKTPENVWTKIVNNYDFYEQYKNNVSVSHHARKLLYKSKLFYTLTLNASPYINFVYEQVKKRNMPSELTLLPIIESGYIPTAKSHRGAAGLWQFTRKTGKSYGLPQSWWYDTRLDVYQSTIAALNYLQDLHYKYQDWLTALAAYNYGTGNIDRAIRRNRQKGLPTDYWSLKLPKETRQYIPKLLAFCYALKHAEKYQLKLNQSVLQEPIISFNVSKTVSIKALSKAAEMSVSDFKKLNSGFLRWAPNPQKNYSITLPQSRYPTFNKNILKIAAIKTNLWDSHKVKRGETLYNIAKFYGIKLKALISVNKSRKNGIIRPGERLVIPKTQSNATKKRGTHRVKSGDTLSHLSKLYKVHVKKLLRVNRLKENSIIRPGDLLIIPG